MQAMLNYFQIDWKGLVPFKRDPQQTILHGSEAGSSAD
jgi:hypothetical protein